MTPAHMHLMFNHFPLIGSLLGLLLFAIARWRKSRDMEIAALILFVVAALFAIPTYLTGEPAEGIVEGLPTFSETALSPHENAAKLALIAAIVLGLVAAYGLWLERAKERLSNAMAAVVLVAGLIVAGLMGYTALLGGQVAHPELRTEFVAPAGGGEEGEGEEAEEEGESAQPAATPANP